MTLDDFLFLLMCLTISLFGGGVFFNRSYESARFGFIDFGEHHEAIGVLLLTFGVVSAYSAFKNR